MPAATAHAVHAVTASQAPSNTGASERRAVVELIYFNAGGGHRASALALEGAIRRAGLPWDVRLTNLRDMLDPSGTFSQLTGMDPEDFYNKRLAHGWTLGLSQELKLLQGLIRWGHTAMSRLLRTHWTQGEPDMVVSLIPNFNRVLCESLSATLPGVPYVTVLTDLADHPPRFWIERDLPQQHVICGSPRAVRQAREAGRTDDRVHATSGMMIRTDFYDRPKIDRAAQRASLGLDPDLPTGIVLFGGHGSAAMVGIAKRLADRQLILACGHNQRLARTLAALPSSKPRLVLGFTSHIAHYMQLADYLIGKPGPGSISEAVQMQLPVIVVRNRHTLPQERYNTEWVRERGVGVVSGSFREIDVAVDAMLGGLEGFRSATSEVRNRAIFEVPEILRSILVDGFSVHASSLGLEPGLAPAGD